MSLNHTKIEALKPKAKPYSEADGRGLSLHVLPSGSKWWRFRYRFDSKAKMLSVGTYPDVSLAQARERREEARKLLADNQDPSTRRKEDKALQQTKAFNSFQQIACKWFDHWKVTHNPRHTENVKSRLERNVYTELGSLPISEITTPQIVKCVKSIADRGAMDIAKRCHQNIGQIFRYAIAHGYAERNPATDIRPSDIIIIKPAVNMARVDEKELPDLLRAIDAYRGSNVTRLATKLMCLTFVRTGTLIGTPWSEIDFDAKLWRIPPERMKMNNQHLVPLCTQTIEVLKTLKILTGHTPLLFPSERGWADGKHMSDNTILKALDRMGYKGRMTGHGFRGVASTILHEQGYDHQHIELQLAHKQRNAIAAAYNHAIYLPQRTEMMQAWGDYLEKCR